MSRVSKDVWIAILIVFVLAVVTVMAASQQARGDNLPSLSTYSSSPFGGQALVEWMEAIGFDPANRPPVEFEIDDRYDIVMVLEPFGFTVSEDDLKELDDWVESGGLLVIVSQTTAKLFENYDFSLRRITRDQQPVLLKSYSPDLTSPIQTAPSDARVGAVLITDREDYLTLYAVDQGPVAVAFERGDGWVVLSTLAYPFTNQGLKQPGNPEVVLNLLALAKESASVWFDEWHHGFMGTDIGLAGPMDWLRHTPSGQAFLYAFIVVFIALMLSGRKFGEPIPPRRERARRPALEYVSALANLKRRAGHRSDMLTSYRNILKRELGRRYRLDPASPDRTYVTQLKAYDTALDHDRLISLLEQLNQADVSEQTMVKLAAAVADMIDSKEIQ